NYPRTRTGTSTDDQSNTTSKSQKITFTHTTAPTLSGVPVDTSADCSNIPAPATVTATDDCSSIPLGVVYSQSRTDGNCAGNYTRSGERRVGEECGTRASTRQKINVTVTDATRLWC